MLVGKYMKKSLRQFKVSITIFLCFSFLIFGIMPFSSMKVNATTVSSNTPAFSSLIPHDPIYITSDLDFVFFPGAGVIGAPYIIEGYNITTTEDYGISIFSTVSLFVIRNCYINAKSIGISINDVTDGTATVTNNTCNSNNHGIMLLNTDCNTVVGNTCDNNINGISILNSDSSTVANNTCNNNNDNGIYITNSGSSTVANNTCNYNNDNGIYITNTVSLTVANNTCNYNNNNGISIWFTEPTVNNNTCNNNARGIDIYNSDGSTIVKNTCSNNGDLSINLWDSDSCIISYNLLKESPLPGVYLYPNCVDNIIHHNNFVDTNLAGVYGASQAYDDGTTNTWYYSEILEGNYWSDWSGTGSYSIDGLAGSIDLYPLAEPVDIDTPLIVDIIQSPSIITELDTISINATVTDDSGIYNVTLHYRINGGTWTEVSMTLISGDIYSVTIGPFAANDIIEYYVTATDNSANRNEATEDNSGSYYSFTVSVVILEFQIYSSSLLSVITFLFLFCGLLVQQRRKK